MMTLLQQFTITLAILSSAVGLVFLYGQVGWFVFTLTLFVAAASVPFLSRVYELLFRAIILVLFLVSSILECAIPEKYRNSPNEESADYKTSGGMLPVTLATIWVCLSVGGGANIAEWLAWPRYAGTILGVLGFPAVVVLTVYIAERVRHSK